MAGKQLHLQRLADQPAIDGIAIVVNSNGTGATDADLKARTAFQALLRQVAQDTLLLQEPLPATVVESGEELAQEEPVRLDAVEIETAAQK